MATVVAERHAVAETETAAPLIVYFSSVSGNTARFVEKLQQARLPQASGAGMPALRIPLHSGDAPLKVTKPFVLVTPTYGGGQGRDEERGAVPKPVIRFLNDEDNRSLLRGVISAGNTNFGEAFCRAGEIISRKCRVPHLYRLELFGTPEDVDRVSDGLERWWKLQ